MNATEIQNLKTGQKVKYLGKTLTITDWKCHSNLVMFGNERIWAEPYFDNNLIHPGFWKEIVLAD